MAFIYEPYITADLYRIFEAMESYANMDFLDFYETLMVTSDVPASRLLYWVVGKTGIYNLVSVLATYISYSFIFYTIHKTQDKYSISRKNVAIALFFLMATSIFISVAGGIRMMLAMTMIVFCFFRESVEQKFRWFHLVLYITAVLMHNMAIIIVGMRVVSSILDKRIRISRRISATLALAAAGVVLLFKFDYMLSEIIDNVSYYLFESSYSDKWEYLIGVILVCVYFYVSRNFLALNSREKYIDIKVYNICMTFGIVTSLVFIFVFSIFYRFIGHLVPILALPMIMITLQESQKNVRNKYSLTLFQSVILLFSFLILFLNCTRGSLSSLKFFVLG